MRLKLDEKQFHTPTKHALQCPVKLPKKRFHVSGAGFKDAGKNMRESL